MAANQFKIKQAKTVTQVIMAKNPIIPNLLH